MSIVLTKALELLQFPKHNQAYKINNKTELPYFYHIENKNKNFYYLGVTHTKDVKNYQLKLIKNYIINIKPDIILLERFSKVVDNKSGFIEELSQKSEEQIVIERGEMGLGAYLAINNQVQIESLEGDNKLEYEYLLNSGFTLEQIFAYHCCACITSFLRLSDWQARGQDYLEKLLIKSTNFSLKPTGLFDDFDFSLANFQRISKSIFNQDFNFHNLLLYKKAVSLIPKNAENWTVLNELCKTSVYYRDKDMIERINFFLTKYDTVMALCGYQHVRRQENSLKFLLNNLL